MLIDLKLLQSYGGNTKTISQREIIFEEGDIPKYYYQITSGRIKLNHYDEEGKEIIQSILLPGQSVCELMLFIDEKYPVNAETLMVCEIIKLPKKDFVKLLDENQDVSRDINKFLAERLHQKYLLTQHTLSLRPEVKLIGALNYFKSYSTDKEKYSFEVYLTRKQLGSITGLRTETVIRTIKKMENDNLLKLENGKIFY